MTLIVHHLLQFLNLHKVGNQPHFFLPNVALLFISFFKASCFGRCHTSFSIFLCTLALRLILDIKLFAFSDLTHPFLNHHHQSRSTFSSYIVLLSPQIIFTITNLHGDDSWNIDYQSYIDKRHKCQVPKGPKLFDTSFKTYDTQTYVLDV